MRGVRVGALSLAACAALAPGRATGFAQAVDAADSLAGAGPRMRTVVVGDRYHAGAFHRFLLGNDYRRLWTAPITLPELNLRGTGGGLRPVKRVREADARSRAKGADGPRRSAVSTRTPRDPAARVRGTFIDRFLQTRSRRACPAWRWRSFPSTAAAWCT
jgi:hypothetical protein